MESEHLAVMMREVAARWGERPALRYKDPATGAWQEISWTGLGEQVQAAAKGLVELGVAEGEKVGIFAPNRPEWAISDYGAQFIRAVSVPIYATNSASQAKYLVDDAEIKVLFVGEQGHYDKVKSFITSYPTPPKVVVFDGRTRLEEDDLYFQDFLEIGRQSVADGEVEARLRRASKKDVATLIYTSGTTGDPQGGDADPCQLLPPDQHGAQDY